MVRWWLGNRVDAKDSIWLGFYISRLRYFKVTKTGNQDCRSSRGMSPKDGVLGLYFIFLSPLLQRRMQKYIQLMHLSTCTSTFYDPQPIPLLDQYCRLIYDLQEIPVPPVQDSPSLGRIELVSVLHSHGLCFWVSGTGDFMIQVISLFLVGALGFQGSHSSDITGIAMLAIPQRERVSEEEKKKI